jgi:hypothetical protein
MLDSKACLHEQNTSEKLVVDSRCMIQIIKHKFKKWERSMEKVFCNIFYAPKCWMHIFFQDAADWI